MKTIRYEGKIKTFSDMQGRTQNIYLLTHILLRRCLKIWASKTKTNKDMVWATRNGRLTQEYNKSNSRMTVVQQI